MNFEDVRETALTVLKMDDAEAVNAYLKARYAQAIKDLGISSLLGDDSEKQS